MYNIVKSGSHAQYGTYDFVADFADDLANAPVDAAAGSKIFCIENSTTYILTPSGNWVEYTVGEGGGSCPVFPRAEGKGF